MVRVSSKRRKRATLEDKKAVVDDFNMFLESLEAARTSSLEAARTSEQALELKEASHLLESAETSDESDNENENEIENEMIEFRKTHAMSVKSFLKEHIPKKIEVDDKCLYKWIKADQRLEFEDWNGKNDLSKPNCKSKLIIGKSIML